MARDPLQTVLRYESDKEQKLAEYFYQAQRNVEAQRQKLTQLQQYRVDYIEQIKQTAASGVQATRYQQHLSFVGKLDLACEQQTQAITQASSVAEQRKVTWLKQQQRKKAIEKLIQKQQAIAVQRANRIEQSEMDEFANQLFYRR
ncbi:flagellar export protein FliJ [Alteromonas sediminis]|uniref:Flagellar FliJ protein n=1 Tax=Alteromonas sediminis TaxID=2259342 RepID=A0A3N5Z4L0_9ALTE|nr:flagellar export protein FliJ [Alteromonas sediminis]RPJ65004.1 flagellar export protein FliJ [Alteromonas sediminis]